MYVDLIDVLREPGSTTEKPIHIAPGMLDDIEVVEPITGDVRVTNARQTLVVAGRAQGAVTMQCARCLNPYAQPVELELEANAPLSYFRGLTLGVQPEDEEDAPDDELVALFDANSLDAWNWCARRLCCKRRPNRCVRPIARAYPKRPSI
jgi:hypothetical protein